MNDGWMSDLFSQLTEPLITKQRGPRTGHGGTGVSGQNRVYVVQLEFG